MAIEHDLADSLKGPDEFIEDCIHTIRMQIPHILDLGTQEQVNTLRRAFHLLRQLAVQLGEEVQHTDGRSS